MRNYPLSIRFWYVVHNIAERIWHWTWRTRISPWHEADRATRPQLPPSYRLIDEWEPSDAERAAGVLKKRLYISGPL